MLHDWYEIECIWAEQSQNSHRRSTNNLPWTCKIPSRSASVIGRFPVQNGGCFGSVLLKHIHIHQKQKNGSYGLLKKFVRLMVLVP